MSKNRIFVKLCNLCCLIPLFFVACDNINTAQILSNAESIVKQYPDSALRLLDSIPLPSLLNERESNLYTLLKIQSSDLSYQDITADTAIFGVKNYYIQNNNIHRAAQASFYSGRVRHEQQDYKQAMEEYLQANDLADKLREDYELKGTIQINIAHLMSMQDLYDEALPFYLKAL